MAMILRCDHCHYDIQNGYGSDNLVRMEVRINGTWIRKCFHKDCFNHVFSTDINKIKGDS